MKKRLLKILGAFGLTIVLLFGIFNTSFAARTENAWDNFVTYMKTSMPSGMDILINGSNHYLNFNSLTGQSGYGFRDYSGKMQVKDNGGSWKSIVDNLLTPGLPYQVLTMDSDSNYSWSYDLGSPTTRLGTIYVDYVRTKWLEVSQNVIDNSFKIGSITNPISTNLIFANTSGEASIIYDTDALFKISNSTRITGNLSTTTGIITPKISPASDSTTAVQITKADGATSILNVDTTNGRVGIGTTNPSATFDVGGGSILSIGTGGTAKVLVQDNVNAISGMQMSNINTGTDADFRFLIKDSTNHYFAFSQPGINNSAGSIFGLQRKTTDFIFNSGGTARDLAIGTANDKALIFGQNNSEVMRIASGGNVGIGTTTPNSKLQVSGSLSLPYVAKTADYTLTASDYTVECTANSFTITLPTAVGITGRIYNIKNTGTGIITIDANGSETIDGELTQLVNQWENLKVQSNGANWILL